MKDAFRNRIRLELLPLLHQYNPKIEESLARTAEALAGDREVLSQAVSEAADSCVMSGKSELSIDLQILKGYNKGLQRNLIRWCCIRLLGPGRPPDFKSVERALNLAFAGRVGQRAILSGGLWARRGYRHLHLGPQNTGPGAQSKAGKNLKIPGSTIWGNWTIKCSIILVKKDKVAGARPQVAYFDRDQLAGQKLWVSSLKPGLKMRLFGSGGTRKIQDMLVDAKVPREERGQRPVVYAGNEPVWLAGIRRSDAAPITDRTKEAIRLELVKNDE
jgi:tRNA(Ile)-lysidine synthase